MYFYKDSYCNDYKDYQMSALPQSNSYMQQVKNGVSDYELVDKDRSGPHAHFYKAFPQDSGVYSSSPQASMIASNVPRYGTIIPNRIFVGGIDFKTKEEDLQKFFCSFGLVKETKIIRDRADVSKGYGFVTFETQEEANKVREQEDCLYLNGKKLNIGQAIRKQQICFPKDIQLPGPPGSWVMHPGGYSSFTNQNGITYFSQTQPMVTALPQSQTFPHGHMAVTYNNGASAYPQLAAHYAGYYPATTTCNAQPCSAIHVPWGHSPLSGACGQIIAPSSALEPVNVVPVQNSQPIPATNYIVPRSLSTNTPNVQPLVTTRPTEVQSISHEKSSFLHQGSDQSIRMIVPPPNHVPASVYPHSNVPQPVLHAIPPVIYQPPVKCAHAQFVEISDPNNPPMFNHYGVVSLPDADNQSAIQLPAPASENEILTPPMTPEQPRR